MLGKKDAEELINLARKAVRQKKDLKVDNLKSRFNNKRGVFITVKTYPERRLRGCIGIPRPRKPLYKAVIKAARDAAYSDPRFPPLKKEDLGSITVELSILTLPEKVETEEAPKEIKVGEDGLIVSKGIRTGLLLPQVAVDRDWDSKEFLEETCRKAGLPRDAWKSEDTEIQVFQAQVFKEKEPGGKVVKEL